MSIRAAGFCVVIIALMGCDPKEVVNTVKHQSAWQRQAGESPQEAARLAKESDENTKALVEMLQKPENKNPDETMRGKLVKLDGQVTEQGEKSWTLQNKDGWTIIFDVSDLTPNENVSKEKMQSCTAQGIIDSIDLQGRKITMKDVEITPELKAGA
jgi:hypothetical protein